MSRRNRGKGGIVLSRIYSVSARALAEFAFERGDLIPAARAAARMREGVRGHQILQQMLPVSWRPEAAVARDIPVDGDILRIHGRADALYIDKDQVRVLEIKTTTRDPRRILKYDYPAHWAQGEIYACLFCLNEGVSHAEVRLTYARLDGLSKTYSEDYMAEDLLERLTAYARAYIDWARAVERWRETSRPTLEALQFPFDSFRDGQREMAAAVLRALSQRGAAVIEAPTGIGKTAAALYGALQALAQGDVTAIFYLTARTTGRRAAEDALERMRARGLRLRSVTITAKEKACLLEKQDCMACPYAAGYYDRRRDALKEALAIQRLNAETLRDLAVEHALCPFELSLDCSENADVIIGDYNYAFDPRVRLKRYFEGTSRAALLVDEAHNLTDRAMEMLSVEISGRRLKALRADILRVEGKDSPMGALMTRLLKAMDGREAEMESLSELPEALTEAIRDFAAQAMEMNHEEPEVSRFVLDCQWYATLAKQFDAQYSRALITPEDGLLTVKLWRFDPSEYLRKALSRVGGAALFSATLTPLSFYAHQLGADGDNGFAMQLESPFPRENLCVLRMGVSVGLRDRERTMTAVCQIIHAMCRAKAGNYLACFPSYAYMVQAFRHYRMLFPDEAVAAQRASMTERERTAFIDQFEPHPRRGLLAFVVLGGVFAEGVDLPGDRLSGAAIVSTGIPQISFEREQLRELLDDADDGGYDAAYTYPGLRRVLQAAGRVIRTERDRGVVLLLDMRYRQEKLRALLPPHWEARDVKKMSELNARLRAFWGEGKGNIPSSQTI